MGIGVRGGFWSMFEVFERKSKIWAPRKRCKVPYCRRPYRLDEIYPSAPSRPPHLNFQFSDFSDPPNLGEEWSPKFRPPKTQNLDQDLDICCLSNLLDPHRVVDKTLLYRKFQNLGQGYGMKCEFEPRHFLKPSQTPKLWVGHFSNVCLE